MTANNMTAAELRKQAEELQQKAQRIEAEAKEAERKAKEEEHRIRREAEQTKIAADRRVWVEEIVKAVIAETETREQFGFKAATVTIDQVHPSSARILINGKPYYNIEFKSEYSGPHSWRSSPTGKMRLIVGDFGNNTSVPQRKDGSFTWSKVAEVIVNEIIGEMRWLEKRNTTDTNNDIARKLAKELGYDDKTFLGYPFEGSDNPKFPIKMKLTCDSITTVDKAKRIIELWKQINAVMSEK